MRARGLRLVCRQHSHQRRRAMASPAAAVEAERGSGAGGAGGEGRKRGAFILFEGVDRCGKTTQTRRLTEALRADGAEATLRRFPDRETRIGTMINGYLASGEDMADETVHLLFSTNRWEAAQGLRGALEEGVHIVADRYAYSGVAFSSAKDAGLGMGWCMHPDAGLPAPDCVIFLDMPVEAAAERGNFGEERYEKLDFQRKVYARFQELREMDSIPWHVVNAQQTIDEVAAEVRTIADDTIRRVADTPLQTLWQCTVPSP